MPYDKKNIQFGRTEKYNNDSASKDAWYLPFSNSSRDLPLSKIAKSPIRLDFRVKTLKFNLTPFMGNYSIVVPLKAKEYDDLQSLCEIVIDHLYEKRKELFPGFDLAKATNKATIENAMTSIFVDEGEEKKFLKLKFDDYTKVVDKDNEPMDYKAMDPPLMAGTVCGYIQYSIGSVSFSPTLDKKLSIKVKANFVRILEPAFTVVHEMTEEEKEYLATSKKSKLEDENPQVTDQDVTTFNDAIPLSNNEDDDAK